MDGEKIQLEGTKGHTSEQGRNINSPAMMHIQILPTGLDTKPSLVAMELPEVRGQEDGLNDNSSLEATTTKCSRFPTNKSNAAFNCRVLFIIQPTMSIKLKKKNKKKNKGSKAMTIEE